MTSFDLAKTGAGYLATITPPQTIDGNISVGKGAYCFVIDVSGRCVVLVLVAARRGRRCCETRIISHRPFAASHAQHERRSLCDDG